MANFGGTSFDVAITHAKGLGDLGWQEDDVVPTEFVPNSGSGDDTAVTFLMGTMPAVKTLPIVVASANWATFKALRQTVGTFVDWDGSSYSDVLLKSLGPTFVRADGSVETTAQFEQTSGT